MNVERTVLGIPLFIEIESEEGMLFAKCDCPVPGCNKSEDSTDDGYGSEHAANITAGKIRTHLILAHGHKDIPD